MTGIGYLICMIVLAGLPIEASAKMFKCTTESGAYSFQDSPCEAAFHDKSYDPVVGTITALPPTAADQNALPDQTMDTPDSGLTADSIGNNIVLLIGALIIYLGLAAFQGWWASMRNRSFWKWFLLAALINPLLTMLIFRFRGVDPVRRELPR
jgi:predicted cobalt transporter CbtA